MRKFKLTLLALLVALSMTACSSDAPAEDAATETEVASSAVSDAGAAESTGPVAEEVKGVTVPAFSITVNDVEVTNETMAAAPLYSVQATSTNSSGTTSTVTYVGFSIKDVYAAAGLTGTATDLEAVADDGYAVELSGDVLNEDTTLLAMTKDGDPFDTAPYFAPCSNETTGNYLKNVVTLNVTVDAAAAEFTASDAAGLPEILDRTDKVEFGAFSFKINGAEVTNETLADLSIYKIDSTSVNKKGESVTAGYTGYKLADVLDACGVPEATTVKAVANDGYEAELDASLINSDYTLIAIEKDKETGEEGTVWVAPCSETSAGSYCKLVVEIVAE